MRTRPGHVPGSSQGLELRQRAAPVHAARVAASQREREGPAARRHVPDRRPGPAWSRHVREVTDLKLSPANDHLVSASNDTTARVWRAAAALSTRRTLPQLDSPHRRRRAPHPQGPRLRHARRRAPPPGASHVPLLLPRLRDRLQRRGRGASWRGTCRRGGGAAVCSRPALPADGERGPRHASRTLLGPFPGASPDPAGRCVRTGRPASTTPSSGRHRPSSSAEPR